MRLTKAFLFFQLFKYFIRHTMVNIVYLYVYIQYILCVCVCVREREMLNMVSLIYREVGIHPYETIVGEQIIYFDL